MGYAPRLKPAERIVKAAAASLVPAKKIALCFYNQSLAAPFRLMIDCMVQESPVNTVQLARLFVD
jgi:hypothetical protein